MVRNKKDDTLAQAYETLITRASNDKERDNIEKAYKAMHRRYGGALDLSSLPRVVEPVNAQSFTHEPNYQYTPSEKLKLDRYGFLPPSLPITDEDMLKSLFLEMFETNGSAIVASNDLFCNIEDVHKWYKNDANFRDKFVRIAKKPSYYIKDIIFKLAGHIGRIVDSGDFDNAITASNNALLKMAYQITKDEQFDELIGGYIPIDNNESSTSGVSLTINPIVK